MKRKITSILLGATICLMLISAGVGVVRAAFLVTNTAGLNYRTGRGFTRPTETDTAALRIVKGPELPIIKDVYNLCTGETSTDMVKAFTGDTIEFVLTITNTGDASAKNVVIIDSIPSGTIYEIGSAVDTNSLDPIDPPDTIAFQHVDGGPFDAYDTTTVTAIKWIWDSVESIEEGNNKRVVKFKVRVQ